MFERPSPYSPSRRYTPRSYPSSPVSTQLVAAAPPGSLTAPPLPPFSPQGAHLSADETLRSVRELARDHPMRYMHDPTRYLPLDDYAIDSVGRAGGRQTTRPERWNAASKSSYERKRDAEKELIYNPMTQLRKEEGRFPIHMPETVYTAVILCWLNLPVPRYRRDGTRIPGPGWGFQMGVMFGPVVVAYIISCVVQMAMSYYLLTALAIHDGEDLSQTCTSDTSWPLRLCACFIYLCAVMSDAFETRDMHMWLSCFRRAERREFFKVVESKDRGDVEFATILPKSGMTSSTRTAIYGGVMLPKVLLSALVLCAGAGVVLRSKSNFELVLNSVAVAFVLEIDELIYKALVSTSVKQRCKAPSFAAPATGAYIARYGGYRRNEYWAFLHTYVALALVVLMGLVQYRFWCGLTLFGLADLVTELLGTAYWPVVIIVLGSLLGCCCCCCCSPKSDEVKSVLTTEFDDLSHNMVVAQARTDHLDGDFSRYEIT
tara:strand:- start:42 stop:1505 length:1464 start_codon:yes stop_codon:yes gene_type:complete